MKPEEMPDGPLGAGPGGLSMLAWKHTEAARLARQAQREALQFIDQLAAQLEQLGIDPAQVEARSGLPAEVVARGLKTGGITFIDFVIVARVLGVQLQLDPLPVVQTQWPEHAADIRGFPRQHRLSGEQLEGAAESSLAEAS